MVRNKQFVTLSDTDEHRLTIYDVPEEELNKLTGSARQAFLIITAITGAVLILMIALGLFFKSIQGWVLFGLMIVIDLFMFGVNVNLYREHIYDYRTRCHYIKVQLVEKLPVVNGVLKETKNRKETAEFYPARAKDLKKANYTTTVYLTKDEYDHYEDGKVMTIYVSLKADREKKKK